MAYKIVYTTLGDRSERRTYLVTATAERPAAANFGDDYVGSGYMTYYNNQWNAPGGGGGTTAHILSGALHTGSISSAQHGAVAAVANAHGHADLAGVTSDQHHAQAHGVTATGIHTGFPGNTTTFLRADGIFAAPPAGGGGPQSLKKSADQIASAVAYQDITGLGFGVNSATDYGFQYELDFQSGSTANGVGFSVNGPASALLDYTVSIQNVLNAATGTNTFGAAWTMRKDSTYDAMTANISLIAATVLKARVMGSLHTSGAAGTLIPRVRSETTAQITIKRGSWGLLI